MPQPEHHDFLILGAHHGSGRFIAPKTIEVALTTKVRRRKQDMVDREIAFHLNAYKTSGAEQRTGGQAARLAFGPIGAARCGR